MSPMVLSVIIVNFNAKYFLEQCLYSLRKAILVGARELGSLQTEIFVLDNHSTDGSLEYLKPLFPEVNFWANKENLGFARANNLALASAVGHFVLFLNPDIILTEDCLAAGVKALSANKRIGALGLRMVDGRGRFLRESKRGYPHPWRAFCKSTGLSAIFPSSRAFAGYYQGQLKEKENGPCEVLSGAFFLARKEVLDQEKGFDERFFMYGEDIDLSYRIRKKGFENHYLGQTTIIHFKGESTTKDLRYVWRFYLAMAQFVGKNQRGKLRWITIPLLCAGIFIRGLAAALVTGLFSKPSKKFRPFQTACIGDQTSATVLKRQLPFVDRVCIDEVHKAEEIILCEGAQYSYQQIIGDIQRLGRSVAIRIHAGQSRSFVGSDRKNHPGQTIAW